MKKFLLSMSFVVSLLPCRAQSTEVLLETTKGNIRIALYDDTPQHRDNFLKLVKMEAYDSLLFHRVIKDFMVQTGDINSKHAKPGDVLGTGDYDYTIEAEFRLPQIFHRRGVVASAREGDDVNPAQRSSACQFYIVWGKTYTDAQLDKVQARLDTVTYSRVVLTPEMREVYKTVGGTPHLDGQYTVFGEVIGGLDVVDSIQRMPTDERSRPLEDVRILKAVVVKDMPLANTKTAVKKVLVKESAYRKSTRRVVKRR